MRNAQSALLAAAATTVNAKHPSPPDELTKDEIVEWYNITQNLPPEWFPKETWHLLCDLCRHIVVAKYYYDQLRKVQTRKGALGRDDVCVMKMLSGMHLNQTKIITYLSVRLRITQPSIYDAATKKAVRNAQFGIDRKPWELPARVENYSEDEDDFGEKTERDRTVRHS